MKPLFAINLTDDKKNEVVNGSEFVTKTASIQNTDSLEENQEELKQSIKKSQLPLWLQIVTYICGIYALIVAASIIKNLDIGFAQMFKNAPALIITAPICGLIWLIFFVYSKIKSKKVLAEENVEQQIADIDKDIDAIYAELGVPDDAINVDILMFRYKIKDGEIKPYGGMQNVPYLNFEIKAYTDGKCLHFADTENIYSFDLSELRGISTVNKRISTMNWNKDEHPRKGEFKQYKITVSDESVPYILYKPFHILEGEHNGEKYGIYFPCYELPAFERLTGLRAKAEIEE